METIELQGSTLADELLEEVAGGVTVLCVPPPGPIFPRPGPDPRPPGPIVPLPLPVKPRPPVRPGPDPVPPRPPIFLF
jgi:hypothetical protein